MLIFFLFTGFRFSIKSRFYQLSGINKSFRIFIQSMFKVDSKEGISQFSTLCSVLGACIGTGNIVGVATAIYSGGPGTVFWMIASACLSLMTAYAENYLGAEYTRLYSFQKRATGALSYIENGLNMNRLSKIYAFLCLCSALGMGNMTQSNSLCDSLKVTFNTPSIATAIAVSTLAFIIINGNVKRIAGFQTLAVPVASIFYLTITIAVIVKFRENLAPIVSLIFAEAFSIRAIGGFGMYKAIRFGISRGVFSNEAGLGSSTLLHSEARNTSGEAQGISAMAEVFIDTIVMCTLTALAILVSTGSAYTTLYGAQLSSLAYSNIGATGKYGIGLLTAVFAFTSLVSCSFYGEKSFQYLFGKQYTPLYRCIYIICIFTGGIFTPSAIWEFADICNGLMAIPNLFAINCLHKQVYFPQKSKKGLSASR